MDEGTAVRMDLTGSESQSTRRCSQRHIITPGLHRRPILPLPSRHPTRLVQLTSLLEQGEADQPKSEHQPDEDAEDKRLPVHIPNHGLCQSAKAEDQCSRLEKDSSLFLSIHRNSLFPASSFVSS